MQPYFDSGGILIYHGDCRNVLPGLVGDVMVTDPPYGIQCEIGRGGTVTANAIVGDGDTTLRDWALNAWAGRPIACFATWRCVPPLRPRGCLVWNKGDGTGLGDLDFPWKPNFEMVWIYGDGWAGARTSGVLTGRKVFNGDRRSGRRHPHEKPADLLGQIIAKAPLGTIVDPFMGAGSTLRAAKDLARPAIGIEIDERYCEIAAERLSQEVLKLA